MCTLHTKKWILLRLSVANVKEPTLYFQTTISTHNESFSPSPAVVIPETSSTTSPNISSCSSNPCGACKNCSCVDVQEYDTERNYLCMQCGSSKATYSAAAKACSKSDRTMHLMFYNESSQWKMKAVQTMINKCSNTYYYWIDNSIPQKKHFWRRNTE